MFLRITRLWFLFCLFFFETPVMAMQAGETAIDINIGSRHSERTYGSGIAYNENNLGLGGSYAYTDWLDFKAGFFENSYHKTTLYGGAWLHRDYYSGDWVIAPGVALFLVSGYNNTPENAPVIAPLPVPGVSLGYHSLRANIGYVPFGKVDVWLFQLQWKLD